MCSGTVWRTNRIFWGCDPAGHGMLMGLSEPRLPSGNELDSDGLYKEFGAFGEDQVRGHASVAEARPPPLCFMRGKTSMPWVVCDVMCVEVGMAQPPRPLTAAVARPLQVATLHGHVGVYVQRWGFDKIYGPSDLTASVVERPPPSLLRRQNVAHFDFHVQPGPGTGPSSAKILRPQHNECAHSPPFVVLHDTRHRPRGSTACPLPRRSGTGRWLVQLLCATSRP